MVVVAADSASPGACGCMRVHAGACGCTPSSPLCRLSLCKLLTNEADPLALLDLPAAVDQNLLVLERHGYLKEADKKEMQVCREGRPSLEG